MSGLEGKKVRPPLCPGPGLLTWNEGNNGKPYPCPLSLLSMQSLKDEEEESAFNATFATRKSVSVQPDWENGSPKGSICPRQNPKVLYTNYFGGFKIILVHRVLMVTSLIWTCSHLNQRNTHHPEHLAWRTVTLSLRTGAKRDLEGWAGCFALKGELGLQLDVGWLD